MYERTLINVDPCTSPIIKYEYHQKFKRPESGDCTIGQSRAVYDLEIPLDFCITVNIFPAGLDASFKELETIPGKSSAQGKLRSPVVGQDSLVRGLGKLKAS